VHGKHDIADPHGHLKLRSGGTEIDKIKARIRRLESNLKNNYNFKTKDAIDKLKAQLKALEPSKLPSKKKPIPSLIGSPASTTSKESGSVDRSNTSSSHSSPNLSVVSLPLTISDVPDDTLYSGIHNPQHKQQPISIQTLEIESEFIVEPVVIELESPTSQQEVVAESQPLTVQVSPPDSDNELSRVLFGSEPVSPVSSVQTDTPVDTEHFITVADKVLQLYTMTMVGIANGDTSTPFLLSDNPLHDEISRRAEALRDPSSYLRNDEYVVQGQTVRYHGITPYQNDLERSVLHLKHTYASFDTFFQTVEKEIQKIGNSDERTALLKDLNNLKPDHTFPEIPVLDPGVDERMRVRLVPTSLSENERAQLEFNSYFMKLQPLEDQLGQIDTSLETAYGKIDPLSADHPIAQQVIQAQKSLGLIPQAYISGYGKVLKQTPSLHADSAAVRNHHHELVNAYGKCKDRLAELRSLRIAICQQVAGEVVPAVQNKSRIEAAMTALEATTS